MTKFLRAVRKDFVSDFEETSLTERELAFISWVLRCVYGWDLKKVSRIKITSLEHWIRLAQKRMTFGNLMAINQFFRPKKRTLWQKITQKN